MLYNMLHNILYNTSHVIQLRNIDYKSIKVTRII